MVNGGQTFHGSAQQGMVRGYSGLRPYGSGTVVQIVFRSQIHTGSSDGCSGAGAFLAMGALCSVPILFHLCFALPISVYGFAFPFRSAEIML